MIYAEASYAGPDYWGRTFKAHHFQHIAAWEDHLRRKKVSK